MPCYRYLVKKEKIIQLIIHFTSVTLLTEVFQKLDEGSASGPKCLGTADPNSCIWLLRVIHLLKVFSTIPDENRQSSRNRENAERLCSIRLPRER
jgi:hypothetical protein